MKKSLIVAALSLLSASSFAGEASFSTIAAPERISRDKEVTLHYHYLAMTSSEVEEATVVTALKPYEPIYAFTNHHEIAYKKSVIDKYAKDRADQYCQNLGFKASKEIDANDIAMMSSKGIADLQEEALGEGEYYAIEAGLTKKKIAYWNYNQQKVQITEMQPFYLDSQNNYHIHNWLFKKINCED